MRSFAKLKPSREFPSLQHVPCLFACVYMYPLWITGWSVICDVVISLSYSVVLFCYNVGGNFHFTSFKTSHYLWHPLCWYWLSSNFCITDIWLGSGADKRDDLNWFSQLLINLSEKISWADPEGSAPWKIKK